MESLGSLLPRKKFSKILYGWCSWAILQKVGVSIGPMLNTASHQASNQDGTTPDFVVYQAVLSDAAAVVICEVKSELGTGGSDPSVQLSFSFGRYWASDDVCSMFL